VVSQESSRVAEGEAASSVTLHRGGIGIGSARISMSTRRDSACSIQRVGIAFRMIRPFQGDRAASARVDAENTRTRAGEV